MIDHIYQKKWVVSRHKEAPLLEERERFLEHCQQQERVTRLRLRSDYPRSYVDVGGSWKAPLRNGIGCKQRLHEFAKKLMKE